MNGVREEEIELWKQIYRDWAEGKSAKEAELKQLEKSEIPRDHKIMGAGRISNNTARLNCVSWEVSAGFGNMMAFEEQC